MEREWASVPAAVAAVDGREMAAEPRAADAAGVRAGRHRGPLQAVEANSHSGTRRTSFGASPSLLLMRKVCNPKGLMCPPPLQYTRTRRYFYPSLFAPGRGRVCFVALFSLSQINK